MCLNWKWQNSCTRSVSIALSYLYHLNVDELICEHAVQILCWSVFRRLLRIRSAMSKSMIHTFYRFTICAIHRQTPFDSFHIVYMWNFFANGGEGKRWKSLKNAQQACRGQIENFYTIDMNGVLKWSSGFNFEMKFLWRRKKWLLAIFRKSFRAEIKTGIVGMKCHSWRNWRIGMPNYLKT